MGKVKNLVAGFCGAIALNILHENLRKRDDEAPEINLLGEEALAKILGKFNVRISNKQNLYQATLASDIFSNSIYYSLIGSDNNKMIWPKAIVLGLSAGIGALKLPQPLGLDRTPVTKTNKIKVLTVAYYLFGALVTGLILKTNHKN
jgi:hypothetical protein